MRRASSTASAGSYADVHEGDSSMSEKHTGEVVQVTGPVLDIRFAHDELPALLNAIEIYNQGARLTAEVAQCAASL